MQPNVTDTGTYNRHLLLPCTSGLQKNSHKKEQEEIIVQHHIREREKRF